MRGAKERRDICLLVAERVARERRRSRLSGETHLFLQSCLLCSICVRGRHANVISSMGVPRICGYMLTPDRHDFYQTPTSLIASFFLKKIAAASSTITFTPSTLELDLLTSDSPPKHHKKTIDLFGTIDTESSKYKIMGTKLEVELVKADGASWPVLGRDERRTGEIIQVGRAGRA